jgi:hypothetical protein
MNAATLESASTALTLPQRAAVALGAAEHEIKLRALLTNSSGIVTVTNKAGRDECHTAYMVLKNARISITSVADGATEDAKAFTKAVKAEALRLLTITEAEESRLQALRDGFDADEKVRKDALIAAERARVDAIQARIAAIRDLPLQTVGKSSAEISAVIFSLAAKSIDDSFEEFADQAGAARLESLDKMAGAENAQRAIEIEAESRHQEGVRQQAEREAEATRLADEAAKLAAERAAYEKERDAQAERMAAEIAAAAATFKAMQDKQNAENEAQRVAMAEQQAEINRGLKVIEDARLLAERNLAEADEAERISAQAEALKSYMADAGANTATVARLAEANSVPPILEILDDDDDADPVSDDEIIALVAETFGMTRAEAIERIELIDFERASGYPA